MSTEWSLLCVASRPGRLSVAWLISLTCMLSLTTSGWAQDGVEQARRLNIYGEYRQTSQYGEAEKLARTTLAEVQVSSPEGTSMAVPAWLSNVALALHEQGRYADAEREYLRAYRMAVNFWRGEHDQMTLYMENLARLYNDLTRYPEAEKLLRRVLQLRETAPRPSAADIATAQNLLAISVLELGRLAEAEQLHRKALATREDLWGPLHSDVVDSLGNLGMAVSEQGRYLEAETLYKKALAMSEQVHGVGHLNTCNELNHLGVLYHTIGRYAEAESYFLKSLAIRRKSPRLERPGLAMNLGNLALLREHQGNFAAAEVLQQEALAIRQAIYYEQHLDIAASFHSLASLFEEQGRYVEAEKLLLRALSIRTAVLGENHDSVADNLNNLAILYDHAQHLPEAETFYQRALAAREKALGRQHPKFSSTLHNLAEFLMDQGKYEPAEKYQHEALALQEKYYSPTHDSLALTLGGLADIARHRHDLPAALKYLDRALQIQETGGAGPGVLSRDYLLRGRVYWDQGDQERALADVLHAMELAEQQRALAAGGEFDRSRLFTRSRECFQQMVAWQVERGHVAEAFAAAERYRARSLLDQFELRGTDLYAGIPAADAQRLRRREANAQTKVAGLRRRLDQMSHRPAAAADKSTPSEAELRTLLHNAQQELLNVYRDIRNVSPAYRFAMGQKLRVAELPDLQNWLRDEQALFLEYVITDHAGWVFVINGTDEPRVIPLQLTAAHAEATGTTPGPLSTSRLAGVMSWKEQSLLTHLGQPELAADVIDRLHSLWSILIPEEVRVPLQEHRWQRLVVVADGPLLQLPFAALVVSPGESPQYLLDVGPAIVAVPSATVLASIWSRPESPPAANVPPVLSLNDPDYEAWKKAPALAAADTSAVNISQYRTAGGRFERLPFTRSEGQQLVAALSAAGWKGEELQGIAATESNLRAKAADRKILHLACHGLAEQGVGNFFGGLALASEVAGTDTEGDGLLTAPEISSLPLAGCELAILSACHTNAGPQQSGEGIWGLSRSFLVAGCRRVVASHWRVDDEAGALLISDFARQLAQDRQAQRRIDYARDLQLAQRNIRNNPRWSSPYYWSTFVLIGPH